MIPHRKPLLRAEPRPARAEHAPDFTTNETLRMKAQTKAMIKRTAIAWGLAPLLWSLNASAHYLWIESDAANVRVYFGEYQEGLREPSGGRLDARAGLEGVMARDARASTALVFEKQADHFAASDAGATGWVLVQDNKGVVLDLSKYGRSSLKPMLFARAARGGGLELGKPALTLDVVPVALAPLTLQVFFKGEPLPQAAVRVYAPNRWMQQLRADERGKVQVSAPWPGLYVVHAAHQEKVSGAFLGEPYDAISYGATLSFIGR